MLVKLFKTAFLTTNSELYELDVLTMDSFSTSMLFEGDDNCKARCRAAAGYVHPTSDPTSDVDIMSVGKTKTAAACQSALLLYSNAVRDDAKVNTSKGYMGRDDYNDSK